MSVPKVLRLVVVALFVIALICAASPTTILGAGWFVWTSAGLILWAGEPIVVGATT